jgi:hypothetical protein
MRGRETLVKVLSVVVATSGEDTRLSLAGFAFCEGESFANVVETCYSQWGKRD